MDVDESKKEKTFEVSIVGDGVTVKRTIDEELAGAVLALVVGRRQAHSPDAIGSSRTPDVAPISIGEFLGEVKAAHHSEKIAAIAVFLSERGKGTFTKEDLKTQFQAAGEPLPRNYARDFAVAVARKWIASANTAGEFYVTNTGRRAVQNTFSDSERS
jgi:hypothetical protein